MKYFYKILFFLCLLLVSGSSIAKNKNTYKSLKQLSVDLAKNQETIIFKWIKETPLSIVREGSRVKIIKPTGETKYYEQFSEFIDDADNLPGSGTGQLATISEYLNRIQQYYPKVYNKIKNFTPEEQARFMTDFPTENTLKFLDAEDDLVDVWKNVYKSKNIEALQAAKRLNDKGLIFNGKFDIINNPGCIGHVDDDIEILLSNDGWVKVSTPRGGSNTHIYFEKQTGYIMAISKKIT